MADAQAQRPVRTRYERGLDGLSAYEIAKARGFAGSEAEWLHSLHGRDGRSVDMAAVEALVRGAVDAWPRPRDGVDGRDGTNGRDGLNGKDAALPAPVPHVAHFEKDDQLRTVLMTVSPVSGSGAKWSVKPEYVDGVMTSASLVPF